MLFGLALLVRERGRVQRLRVQSLASCLRVVRPGRACSDIDSVAVVAFRGQDMCEQPVTAPVVDVNGQEPAQKLGSKLYPKSRNPPGGRGQSRQGIVSRSVVSTWSDASEP